MKTLKKALKGIDFFYVHNSKGYIFTTHALTVFNADNVKNGKYELKYFIESNDFVPYIDDNYDKSMIDILGFYKKCSAETYNKLSITNKEVKVLIDNLSDDETRPAMQLIHIDNNFYVSTNGQTMSMIKSRDNVDMNLYCNNKTRCYYHDCKSIEIGTDFIKVTHDKYDAFICRCIDKFVPYIKVIPENNNISIPLPIKADIEKSQKMQKMADKNCTPYMILSNKDYKVKIQTVYLLHALKLGIETITCNADNKNAVYGANGDIKYIIMPMTITVE